MGVVQTATYAPANSSTARTRHYIETNYSVDMDNRVIVVASAYPTAAGWDSSWRALTYTEQDGHFIGVFVPDGVVFQGIASFHLDLTASSRVCHMWMVEHTDCENIIDYFSTGHSGSRMVTFPTRGYMVGGFHFGGGEVLYTSNFQGLYVSHRATNVNASGDYHFSSDFGHRGVDGYQSVYIDAYNLSPYAGYTSTWAFFSRDATPPTTPYSLTVTSKTATSVSVSWGASSDNESLAGYGVYVNGSRVATTESRYYTATDLAPNRSHTIEVDAYDYEGNRSSRASLTVHLDATPPSQPGRLRLTGMSATSATVAWDAASDAGGVTGYGVFLDGARLGSDQAARSRTLTGLSLGRQYTVDVDATDASGNRSTKATLTFTVVPDIAAPTSPPGLKITSTGAGSFAIAWQPASDDNAVAGYGTYLNGTKHGGDIDALTKSFTGLTAGATYTVAVDAVDLHGNRSIKAQRSVEASPDTAPPTAPGDLRTVSVSGVSIALAWDASSDNIDVAGYGVWLDDVKQADIPGLYYRFNGLAEGTTYTFAVDAYDAAGNRSPKAELSVLAERETVPPTEPAFVAQTESTHSSVTISWEESTDNDQVIGYDVLVNGVRRGHTAQTTFVIGDLAADTTYLVAVRAVDRSGNTSQLVEIDALTDPPPYMPVASPVYLLGSWVGNVVDEDGVTWTVEDEDGWSSSPPVRPVGGDNDGDDGGFAGSGLYGPRVITLTGVAVARSHESMLAAKQRLAGLLHPRQSAELRVIEQVLTRRAQVRLSDQVEVADIGTHAFRWSMVLTAADPRRYGPPITSEESGEAPNAVEVSVTVDGDWPEGIPVVATIRNQIRAPKLLHVESGVEVAFNDNVELSAGQHVMVDLLGRDVIVHNPQLPAGQQTVAGARSLVASSTWFQLQPGPNTIRLTGLPHSTDPAPVTLAIETADAWI
ncbi:fibronectin type III domain-containing protein [Planomonospora sp. ID82291]|uniref:fibronectin type III domain-containing protein n=1 Tax=Planomonospora sp. ID82291 TaxID=2738136 RepID=UPI0018C424E2|nr:phage tail family protein [Planomonospora sp. ID82291]MBG0818251.1 phage tail family protein [Planomonospora sp. ID82291]